MLRTRTAASRAYPLASPGLLSPSLALLAQRDSILICLAMIVVAAPERNFRCAKSNGIEFAHFGGREDLGLIFLACSFGRSRANTIPIARLALQRGLPTNYWLANLRCFPDEAFDSVWWSDDKLWAFFGHWWTYAEDSWLNLDLREIQRLSARLHSIDAAMADASAHVRRAIELLEAR